MSAARGMILRKPVYHCGGFIEDSLSGGLKHTLDISESVQVLASTQYNLFLFL
jgi:hypothetical protein